MNVVVYARYSYQGQSETSIEGQLEVCRKYAEQNNFHIIYEYIDRGISGRTDHRPAFQQMISDSSKRNFSAILVYQLDRFARDRYANAIYKQHLKKNGVKVISAMEPISDDASGVLIEAVLEGMGEYYSIELAQKIRRGQKICIENGTTLGGQTPLGYKIENKRYIINTDTAPVVRKIYEMYLANATMAEIIRYLNGQGIRTQKGNEYNKNSIRRILTNRKYIGCVSYNGEEYKNKVPAIVDEDTFNRVQIMMEKNKKAPARAKASDEQYILTTKLYCGECNAPMTGISGYSHTGVPYQYYSCVNARKKGRSCHKSNVRKDLIENAVVRVIRDSMSDSNISSIAKEVVNQYKKATASSNLPVLQKRLSEVKKAQDNLLHAIEQGQAIETLTAQLAKRQAEEEEIKASIAKEKLQDGFSATVESVISYLSHIRDGSENDIFYRQSLVNIYVDSVYLYDTSDGKNKKISVHLNTRNGVKEIPIDDLESSSMGSLVRHSHPKTNQVLLLKIPGVRPPDS